MMLETILAGSLEIEFAFQSKIVFMPTRTIVGIFKNQKEFIKPQI
jgi:hypothetical protein